MGVRSEASREVRLTRTLSALSDPTRRAMVARLARGSATAGELAEPFSIGLPTVSKHLRSLESSGLVTRERRAQWHVFQLRGQPLAELSDWLRTYEAFWLNTLDSLDEYVKVLRSGQTPQAAKTRRAAASRKSRS